MDIGKQSLIKQSLAMAQCAKAAYEQDSRSTLAHWGFYDDYRIINYKNTPHAHVASSNTHILIAFKGTKNNYITDLLADADLWPHVNGNSWVHRGFKRRAEWLLPAIIRYVRNHKHKSIYITGHSLGGALAVFTAYELERIGFSDITVFTFGCPRVGNKAYTSLIKSNHYRFVNCNDFVPRMPLSLIGYRHHGQLYYLNQQGDQVIDARFNRLLDQLRARIQAFKRGKLFDGYADHKMNSYIKKLDRLASISEN